MDPASLSDRLILDCVRIHSQTIGGIYALIDTPPGMSDNQAHDIVVGMAEPVVIGPWALPIDFMQN
jgi:hypothetical protein